MMRQVTENEFLAYARQGNLIPVFKDIYGDLETPVAAYIKLSSRSKYSFLLESVEGGEKLARYSFLARDPECVVRVKDHQAEVLRFQGGQKSVEKRKFVRSPLELVRELTEGLRFVNIPGLPQACGGFVGYLSYDAVRFFEKIPDTQPDDLNLPDMVLMMVKDMVIFDHLHHTVKVVACVQTSAGDDQAALRRKYREALRRIDRLIVDMDKPLKLPVSKGLAAHKLRVRSNCTRKAYEKMVVQAKAQIKAGEIIQAVISQRFDVDIKASPVNIYRTLRSLNPSPYMYLLNIDDFAIVGSSPELLVRCEKGLVETRPIAGTRPRGKTPE